MFFGEKKIVLSEIKGQMMVNSQFQTWTRTGSKVHFLCGTKTETILIFFLGKRRYIKPTI